MFGKRHRTGGCDEAEVGAGQPMLVEPPQICGVRACTVLVRIRAGVAHDPDEMDRHWRNAYGRRRASPPWSSSRATTTIDGATAVATEPTSFPGGRSGSAPLCIVTTDHPLLLRRPAGGSTWPQGKSAPLRHGRRPARLPVAGVEGVVARGSWPWPASGVVAR